MCLQNVFVNSFQIIYANMFFFLFMLDEFQYIQYFDFTLILACVLLSIIFADCSRESDSCVDKLLSQKLKYTG